MHDGWSDRPCAELTAGSEQSRHEPYSLSGNQIEPLLIDFSNTDPRPLQVLDDRDRHAPTIRCFANGLDRTRMRFVGPMRKVESRRVHPALYELIQHSG
jgi:hypothetical protein